MRVLVVTVYAAIALLTKLAGEQAWAEVRPMTRISEVQTAYLEHCGGCHGIHGTSAPREVPSLRGQVANFLCTSEGREYLIRLPNVALAPLSDAMLADVMNFVVLELGRDPQQATGHLVPYTAAEVAKLRQQPLTNTGLADYRTRLVEGLIERCGAPASLRTYAVQLMSSG